ncbi:MAG: FAD-dependent oxidoreductase [bacterium]|nr:FAD-dependent oxidoreductase [bacterium]
MTNPDTALRLIIIGGVAGGASAAARARRLSEAATIILFERGPDVSFANCGLPYYIAGTITNRDNLLVQTPQSLSTRFNIDVRVNTEVIAIDRSTRTVTARNLRTGEVYQERYDKLILSPGAEPVRPPIPGTDSPFIFTLRTLADMDAIRHRVDELSQRGDRHAVIVGGGYIGLEMAEALRERALDVTLVELLPHVMSTVDPEIAVVLHDTLLRHGVDLRLQTAVSAFSPAPDRVHVSLSDGTKLHAGLVVLATGVRPDTTLARAAGLQIGPHGGILVDPHMRTSDPDIYAVGDAVECPDLLTREPAIIPLAGPANRQGRIAADNIFGRPSTYKGSQGTAICKVFDTTVAVTGLNEKQLRRLGRPFEAIIVHPNQHAGYYPGARPLTIKLLFNPQDGKLWGAQAVGSDGVDKRIDVLATALRAGLSVFDLEDLELCYAPPYGSAKDPVNMAGFVAANVLRGDVRVCHLQGLQSPRPDQLLLDVRTPAECALGMIPGAINIPLDELRARLAELPRDKEIIAYCQVGLRGYLACRILSQHGFRCLNLTGGFKTYRASTSATAPTTPCSSSESAKPTSSHSPSPMPSSSFLLEVDACGSQCPGPIMKLRTAIEQISPGQRLRIRATDPSFTSDLEAWCHSTGHTLVSLERKQGVVEAVVERVEREQGATHMPPPPSRAKTLILFSGDLDRALAAFIIANGAAAMGSSVTMFFTFWGINVLRRSSPPPVQKSFLEKMFAWMMPRGAHRLKLSKMHMAGIGTAIIKAIMQKKNVPYLPELIEQAKRAGVRLVACTMSMDLMGIKPEELIDGVEFGGVATYLDRAEASNVNLFL